MFWTFSSLRTDKVGPAIGGVLCQYLSWNWIFFINIPAGIVAILLGAKVIPVTGVKRTGGFDRAGATLIFVGLASLLFALSEGQTFGWTTPVIIVAFAIAILTLGGFIYCELRAPDPLLELRLFTRKNFLMTNLIIALIFFCYGGINYLFPFYLEYVQHFVPSTAGLILTSLLVTWRDRRDSCRDAVQQDWWTVTRILAGISIVAGFLMMTMIRVDTSTGFVVACLMLFGFGMGLMLTPVSNMIMNLVARKYQGMVSGLIIVERFAPMSMGIALFNLVFMQGIITVATHNEITRTAPVNIKIDILMTGFDLAFIFAFLVGVIILLPIVARQETHPDYQQVADEPLMPPAL